MMVTICDDDDTLTEILVRLPTKSLIQLKSVCKRWRSLISGHRFSLLHTLRHTTTTTSTSTSALILRRRRRFTYSYLSLGLYPNRSCIKIPFTLSGCIIQSCNGLVLCHCPYPQNALASYFIYNIASRLWRTIDVKQVPIEGLALAFDPSKSAYYKIICVKLSDLRISRRTYQIDVFDSESLTWSVVVNCFTAPLDVDFTDRIYWNNAVHWSSSSGYSMYFDLDKGVIGTSTKVPAIHWRRHSESPLFVESGGHLHFIITDCSKLTVLELEKDYSKWSIKYHVEYARIRDGFQTVRVFGIIRRQNEHQSFLIFHVPGKLMAYNIIDQSFEELIELRRQGLYDERYLQYEPFHLHQFVETLAPI